MPVIAADGAGRGRFFGGVARQIFWGMGLKSAAEYGIICGILSFIEYSQLKKYKRKWQ